MNTHRVRRVVGAASAGALALGLSAGLATSTAQAAVDERPATLGAAWLAAQPVDGLVTTSSEWGEFTDYGLSVDVALALHDVGGQTQVVTAIRDAVAEQLTSYVEYEIYPAPPSEPKRHLSMGSVAKAAVLEQRTGGSFALHGQDLISVLEEHTVDSGARAGRIEDVFNPEGGDPESPDADWANVIGQSYAVQALDAADSAEATQAVTHLIGQQCPGGGFPLNFDPAGVGQGCDNAEDAHPDATALALTALASLQSPSAQATVSILDGTEYLRSTQKHDGSFGGDSFTEESNANSTGLAGSALAALGETEAAEDAAAWVRSHQLTGIVCEPGAGAEVGAIAYNDADLAAAAADGIDDLERGIFVRAAAQALPVLRFAPAAEGALGVAGPSGFVKAGGKVTLTAEGLAPGERACLVGGKAAVAVTGGASGATAATVALPAGTATRTLSLVTADATTSTTVQALGKAELSVKSAKAQVKRNKRVKVTVKGLAAGEKVTLKVAGKKAAAGKAGAKGTFTAKVKVGRKTGKAKLKAVGQFKNRSGATTVKVK